jgi:hypothetical protein
MKPVNVAMAAFAIAAQLLLSGCWIDWQHLPPTPPSEGKCCGGSGA